MRNFLAVALFLALAACAGHQTPPGDNVGGNYHETECPGGNQPCP